MARPEESTKPLYRPQYITFTSVEEDFRIVEVLADEAGPVPSGGYPLWTRLKRPQRLSLTIVEGYEPFVFTVPILFDSVRRVDGKEVKFQENIEEQIQWLEWMANRGGKSHPEKSPFLAAVGKPPLVKVYASSSQQAVSQLIPKQFQNPQTNWFIEDIIWDDHPIRDRAGARLRQKAVVRLVEFVQADPLPGKPPKERLRKKHTTKSMNTLRKVVVRYLVGTRLRLPEAMKATLEANKGNRAIGWHPDKKLKNGTPILIPERFFKP